MTSLIDVIFLLLLFFMLTSTFTRFAEVEIAAGGGGAGTAATPPLFAQLGPDTIRLNGTALPLSDLAAQLRTAADGSERVVLIALRDGVTAQRLTDVLVAVRAVPGVKVTVLGS